MKGPRGVWPAARLRPGGPGRGSCSKKLGFHGVFARSGPGLGPGPRPRARGRGLWPGPRAGHRKREMKEMKEMNKNERNEE